MKISQPVINTFKRVGIDADMAEALLNSDTKMEIHNRFTGVPCEVNPLIYKLIMWVYKTSNAYESGDYSVKISDFDRIRYFIATCDSNAYFHCID